MTGQTWWQKHADAKWESQAGGVNAISRLIVRRRIVEAGYDEVVDFGCGLAIDAEILENEGVAYTGIEQCEKFRAAIAVRGVSVVDSLSALPDKSADVVYCRHVLEHLAELVPTLLEMIRVAERELIVITAQTPTDSDQLSFDPDRDLYWNVWGKPSYAAALREAGVHSYGWENLQSFEGIGGKDESILYARLR